MNPVIAICRCRVRSEEDLPWMYFTSNKSRSLRHTYSNILSRLPKYRNILIDVNDLPKSVKRTLETAYEHMYTSCLDNSFMGMEVEIVENYDKGQKPDGETLRARANRLTEREVTQWLSVRNYRSKGYARKKRTGMCKDTISLLMSIGKPLEEKE